jgi:hypothetical protein
MSVQAPSSSAKIPVALSLGVVGLCLLLGSGFVWWYLKGPGQGRTVVLSAADMTSLQSAGRQLTYQNNGGVPLGGGMRRIVNRGPADPDGVFGGLAQSIRAGQVMVVVRLPLFHPPGARPVLVFRQRNWGMLQETTGFTIARRLVHEDALARQLAVTPQQLAQIAPVVATPVLKGTYIGALPISPEDEDRACRAWADYQTALAGKDGAATAMSLKNLLQTVKSIGNTAMIKARKEYADADKTITDTLTPKQIEAYRAGKTLQ